MKKALFTSLVLVLLAGCNATMQQPAQRKTSADDPSRICFNSLGDDAQLIVLHPKVGKPHDMHSATLPMLASTEKVSTEEERKAIQYWAQVRNTCVEAGARFREIHAPAGFSDMVVSQNSQFVVLLSKLYSGSITYGEFNTQRRELAAKTSEVANRLREQERNANAVAQQARVAEQARQNVELNNALMLLQASQPRPMPIQNNNLSCTSQNLNGTVHTNCR